jgi:hypothetical protein
MVSTRSGLDTHPIKSIFWVNKYKDKRYLRMSPSLKFTFGDIYDPPSIPQILSIGKTGFDLDAAIPGGLDQAR